MNVLRFYRRKFMAGDLEVDVGYAIDEVLSHNGRYFVRLVIDDSLPAEETDRNVRCYDSAGKLLWKIKGFDDKAFAHGWIKIELTGDGRLWASDFSEIELEIRQDTGEWIKGSHR